MLVPHTCSNKSLASLGLMNTLDQPQFTILLARPIKDLQGRKRLLGFLDNIDNRAPRFGETVSTFL
jgi:hypothetical protein